MKMTKSGTKKAEGDSAPSKSKGASTQGPSDWRTEMLAHIRSLIKQADPEVVEEVKWRKPSNSMLGVPVWEHAGMICTGEMYKDKVKLTFAHGASLDDPRRPFQFQSRRQCQACHRYS
jgi:hypothetical protein